MRSGWIASLVLHAGALAAFSIGLRLHTPPRDPIFAPVVPVEAIIGDVTNIAPIASPAPVEPEETQVQPEGAPLETLPGPLKIPETAPDPKPQQPKKPPPEPKESLDLNELSKLLDRSAKTEGAKRPQNAPNAEQGEKPREGVGPGTGLTAVAEAKVRALLREGMRRCWSDNSDSPDPGRLVVRVRFRLDPGGALIGQPQLLTPIPPGDRELLVAGERALTAVRACAPYNDLPPDLYRIWDEVTMRFGGAGGIQ